MAIQVLNCQGLNCPQPVIRTKDMLAATAEGELLVIVDNEAARDNVRRFAESQGHAVTVTQRGGLFHLVISRGSREQAGEAPAVACPGPAAGKRIVVHISSEFMGQGDDGLGGRLMAAYFDTLAQFAKDITHVTLVNSAVKLIAQGSPVLAEARELEKLGVQFIACGVCLSHFALDDKVEVGILSNMYSIIAAHKEADLLLHP
ncbi:MAG: sulfurtransferase-like selenium metabolism protein YedF [Deltaproteobacteria bacterium]|jgi:selenium metabolism protein YedF|nr:sulfurtransferase-like selenium metabolism protein YedF [Deltaproteobacteria bacterium]